MTKKDTLAFIGEMLLLSSLMGLLMCALLRHEGL